MSGEEKPSLTRLSDLIKAANQHSTYDELAKRAIDPDTGTQLRRSVLSKIANGGVLTMPPAGHIGALAAALELDYEIVRRAAFLQYMPPRDKELRDTEEETLARMLSDGVDVVTALVARTYRLEDSRGNDERAERYAEAETAIEEAEQRAPTRIRRHPRSA